MSVATEMTHRSSYRTAVILMIPLLVIGGGVAGYLTYAAYAGNAGFGSSGSGTAAASSTKVEFGVSITHQNEQFADLGWLIQMAEKGQYWSASCYVLCHGVTYKLDPVITNEGHDVEQCDIFDHAGTVTCEWGVDVPDVIWLSTSTNAVAATDTEAGSTGPCYGASGDGQLTSGGLTDAAGTVTAGAEGSTVTTTIAHTFTAAETDTAVQATCLKTETNSGSHIYIYAEGTFGPDTLTSGNTLTITWTIART